MTATKLLFYTLELLLLLEWTISEIQDDNICTVNADGTQTCTPDNTKQEHEQQQQQQQQPVTDHLEHIWALPKTYDCDNERDERDCQYWAINSKACKNNPGFMVFACPKSCGFCHLKNPKVRCQRHPNAKAAVKPGDINKMFERLLSDFPQYNPTVLSRDPWLVQLHNVFTDEECDTFIKIGGLNFRRSVDAGKMKGNGAKFEEIISDARTSSTTWCTHQANCWDNPVINGMAQKAENITLIPKENSEFFQVLRYKVGQYYVQHHDYIVGHLDLPIGPRVYTFFLYLNTPIKGGGTKFNKLGIIVPAEKGSVAIWPSVLNDDPYKKEYRTNHEALPVEEGVKYGANMWLHMYNFHDPYKVTCTG